MTNFNKIVAFLCGIFLLNFSSLILVFNHLLNFWVVLFLNLSATFLLFYYSVLHVINSSENQKEKIESELIALKKDFISKLNKITIKHMSSAKLTALGNMAGSIAHEINNPLSIIRAKAEILLMKVETLTFSEKDRFINDLKIVLNTTDRISKVIKGMYVLSKTEDNSPITTLSLDRILKSLSDLVSFKTKYSKVNICYPAITGIFFEGRESQVLQMLSNLILNSCEALGNSENSWIKIEATTTDHELKIMIIDSGSGIDSDISKNIMDPFFTTKKIGEGGLGLGLSISKNIAEDLGGSLEYNSKSSNTEFIVKLPVVKYAKTNNL